MREGERGLVEMAGRMLLSFHSRAMALVAVIPQSSLLHFASTTSALRMHVAMACCSSTCRGLRAEYKNWPTVAFECRECGRPGGVAADRWQGLNEPTSAALPSAWPGQATSVYLGGEVVVLDETVH